MPRDVPADHFRTGAWAAAGPLRFRHYTCTQCGTRLKTWVGFQAHRPACSGELSSRPATAGAWRVPADVAELLALARAEEADALAALDPGPGPALDGLPLSDPGSPGADARQTPAGARR